MTLNIPKIISTKLYLVLSMIFLCYRRMIWEGHVELVAKHNREFDFGMHTYTLGINEYADMVSTIPSSYGHPTSRPQLIKAVSAQPISILSIFVCCNWNNAVINPCLKSARYKAQFTKSVGNSSTAFHFDLLHCRKSWKKWPLPSVDEWRESLFVC